MNKKLIGAGLIMAAAAYVYWKKELEVIPGEKIPTSKGSFNNPLNIKISGEKFKGEVTTPSCCFKSFASIAYGYRAGIVILRYYYNHYGLKTITEWINRWAPASDNNNTPSYINYVCTAADISPNEDLGQYLYNDKMIDIVTAMGTMEGAVTAVNSADVRNGFNLA